MPTPLSCCILTLDSERRLAQVLEAVRPVVDEIVIVDSGSIDETLAIASRFDCRILTRPFDNFRNQRVFAEENCVHEWVLMLDSDEVAPAGLVEEIAALKKRDFDAGSPDAVDGYWIWREWLFRGRPMHTFYPIRTPDHVVRLYRRDRIGHQGSRIVHEAPEQPSDKLGHLDHMLLHYTCDSVDQLYAKTHLYTKLLAEDMHVRGVAASNVRLLLFPFLIAIKYYFFWGGWKDGARGLIHARYVCDTVYLTYLKLKYDYHRHA